MDDRDDGLMGKEESVNRPPESRRSETPENSINVPSTAEREREKERRAELR